ncbi:MAG: YggS family pyridoxal phosphate-dependent enzyme [Aeromicrobium sp.]|uniref:YggS family pyridoxal phosphate-dependent enzyme n=1 Tax=Aeromicrobium sp. TaxID=1871063 RepID=UPI0039E2385A
MTDRRTELAANLAAVHDRVAIACADVGRDRGEVEVIVVTKTYPRADAETLVGLGVTDLGENRHPEAADKAVEGARLHFVGGLQTNKAGAVARYADVVHSVDRLKLARSLARGAQAAERTLGALVQVDFQEGADAGRAGIAPGDALTLADEIAALPGLRLDGLMTVAPLGVDPRPVFDTLADLGERLRRDHPEATMVSAGMSGDLEAAVAAGATHLRIGRAVLGERPNVV